MSAAKVIPIRAVREAVESFGGRRSRTSRRLTEAEAADLRYLWQGYAADLGIRSLHGIIERQLLLAPPRDVQTPVLEELVRAGGFAPEGRIIRLVVAEGLATRHEVKRAIAQLSRVGRRGPRIERIPCERPVVEPDQAKRTHTEQQRLDEWTGYDLRLTERGAVKMRLSLEHVGGRTKQEQREERWRRQDEALEREHHMLAVGSGCHTAQADPRDESLTARRRAAANRAIVALGKLTRVQVLVLQRIFGEYHKTDDAELLAITSLVPGTSRARASQMRDDACDAYRIARGLS